MRLPLRPWFRRVHLILSLGVGAIFCLVAGSGAALVFREDLRSLGTRAPAVTWDGAAEMGFVAARDRARELRPDHTLQILWFPTQARPYYAAAFESGGERFVDPVQFHPATGEVLPLDESPVLDWITTLHVNLHLGEPGGFLVRWSTLLFGLVLLSGLYLWWPGFNPRLWFKLRPGSLRVWDLHRVLGFFSSVPLLIMVCTGAVFAFPLAVTLVYLATGDSIPNHTGQEMAELKSDVPEAAAADAPDEQLLRRAQGLAPADAMLFYITFPTRADDARQVRLQRGYSPWPYGEIHRVYFDRYSGQVLGYLRPDGSAARFVSTTNSELHYGTFGGRFTQVLWFITCVLVPGFALTGFLLWRARVHRRSATAARPSITWGPAEQRPPAKV